MREREQFVGMAAKERADRLADAGRRIQNGWNRLLGNKPPGTDPKTHGLGPADMEEARTHKEWRQQQKAEYMARLLEREEAERQHQEEEAAIREKVIQFEAELRAALAQSNALIGGPVASGSKKRSR